MPPLRYWFTQSAAFQVAALVFATVVSLLGLRPVISEGTSSVVMAVAGGLTLWAWIISAKQAEESDKQKKLLELLRPKDLDALKGSAVENLTGLSGAEIKHRVAALTDRMRVFERGVLESRYGDEIGRRSSEANYNFRHQFLPEATALRGEMARRLGITQPFATDHRTVALDYGMLAGVSPISDAAIYLETLARQLPN